MAADGYAHGAERVLSWAESLPERDVLPHLSAPGHRPSRKRTADFFTWAGVSDCARTLPRQNKPTEKISVCPTSHAGLLTAAQRDKRGIHEKHYSRPIYFGDGLGSDRS